MLNSLNFIFLQDSVESYGDKRELSSSDSSPACRGRWSFLEGHTCTPSPWLQLHREENPDVAKEAKAGALPQSTQSIIIPWLKKRL